MLKFVFAGLLVCSCAFAADKPADVKTPGMDPAMMQKLKEYATPSEGHKMLKDLAGKWTYTSKMWMEPTSQPEVSKGTANSKLIMDGRFVQQDVTGKAMGQTFKGMGLIGYNNMTKEYETTWIDNMGTGTMHGEGTMDNTTKTMTEKGTFSCPMTNDKTRAYRGETKWTGKNTYSYSMFMNAPDGKEFKTMELEFKRVQ